MYRTQKQKELQEFKKEKEERKMIIKQMRDPQNRLRLAQGYAADGVSIMKSQEPDKLNSARSRRGNDSSLYQSSIARIQARNEELRKKKMELQRTAYLDKLKKEKVQIQRTMVQMKELQSIEMRLLESV